MRISHEAIYQALYIQGRGALRRELTACLRTGRALRVPRPRTPQAGQTQSPTPASFPCILPRENFQCPAQISKILSKNAKAPPHFSR